MGPRCASGRQKSWPANRSSGPTEPGRWRLRMPESAGTIARPGGRMAAEGVPDGWPASRWRSGGGGAAARPVGVIIRRSRHLHRASLMKDVLSLSGAQVGLLVRLYWTYTPCQPLGAGSPTASIPIAPGPGPRLVVAGTRRHRMVTVSPRLIVLHSAESGEPRLPAVPSCGPALAPARWGG